MMKQQAKEPGAHIKFRLLMWKNFLHQWRHRNQTIAEMLLPVLTMTLVLILRWQIEPTHTDTITYPPLKAHTLNFSTSVLMGMNITQMSVAYSPNNPILSEIVTTAVANLLLRNAVDLLPIILELIPNIPDIERPPNINLNTTDIFEILKLFIKPYDNSTELKGIYADEDATRKVIVAIEFDDNLRGVSELPMKMSYALRFPERPRLSSFFGQGGRSWRTDAVFPVFEVPGPRFPFSWEGGNDPGYVNEMFIALQHVISTELVRNMTGERDSVSTFDVNVQRYPHPPYVRDMAVEALQYLFPMLIVLCFSYTAVNIIRAVTVEKELQLKETMKIMGLPTWLHWTAWFCKQFIYLLVTSALIVALLKINWFSNEDGFSDYAVFTNTPWTVLWFFLLLYLICTIFFCFMLSGFFSKGSTAALFMGVIWFLTYLPAFLLSVEMDMSMSMQAFTCLLLNSAMSYGFQLLLAKESTGGLQWGEFMASPATDSSRFLFGHVVLMLVLDCVLYMLIALYLEQVFPGPFGTPKPWYFPFQKRFWCAKRKISDNGLVVATDMKGDLIKEKDPTNLPIGVKLNKLTKAYGTNIAVNNLSMNIYDDQITVLLGHNGAGKSTTLSMLTGNLAVTSGSVTVAGYDMASQAGIARSHLGFCPQHNVLFNELTVREHIEFFARLKGFTGKELYDEIDTLIEKLELVDKRDYQSKALSGGQKRRLCVGIALCGAARVVLLDEPTSGMDPASRRALWDLLQREKKGRSMILTTHFMDEADILGDRVAIMANGQLQCVGSPYFLKRHYGVGYTLVVVKDEGFDYEGCSALINKYIPGTSIKEDRGSEVTYSLLNEHSSMFEKMLNDLENNIGTLKFKNYGLVATTLEDVFMSVGADLALLNSDSEDAATTIDSTSDDALKYDFESTSIEQMDREDERMSGFTLFCQHILAIWMKLWLVWTRSWILILLHLLVPVLLINTSLGIFQYMMSFMNTIQARELTLSEGYTKTETFLSFNGTSSTSLGSLAKAAYEIMFKESSASNMDLTNIDQPIDEYYLDRGQDPTEMGVLRHRVITGASFDDGSVTAWFSNFGYHDAATSLAAVHQALLKAYNSSAQLSVFNHPLDATYKDQSDVQTMVTMLSMQLSSGVGSSIGIVSGIFIMFYIKERISGAKLLQKAAGVQPIVMWGSAALFDWLWFLIICVTIVISCFAFNVVGLSSGTELGRMYLCFMVYGLAMLPVNYVCSNVFNSPALGFVIVFFVNALFGMMGAQIVEVLSSPFLDTKEAAEILDGILQFFPLYSLVTSVRSLNQIGLTEFTCLQGCEYLAAAMPNLQECTMEAMCENFSPSCCVRENPYFDWESPGVLRYLLAMLTTCAVAWCVLMVMEYRLFQKIFRFKKTPPPVDESTLDEDVADEAKHALMVDKAHLSEHGLVTKGLSKYYGKHLAVDQVSFSVNDGECFGLLGVNGAGKTTTFMMLMGDEAISSGEAYVSGYSVQRELTNVHNNIGYCPQFDALFSELTGRETLRLFSLLRGLRTAGVGADSRAVLLAHALGFLKHLDKRVDQYSGGTKRKLNTAIAFLGRTRLIFVDEPTTGVDPAAKRHVWRATRGVQAATRGVVLTSHSMEECEALCSRLTIMVNGRFQCLGTPQHLKNKFSQGFTLIIKMKIKEDGPRRSTTSECSTEVVKNYVNSNFTTPKIMEEYQGLLTYYLPDRSMPWWKMFGIMERAKQDLAVEDYSISQTTLEQIFLQFTKYQREEL